MGKPRRTPLNQGTAPRIERKVIEKNRRIKMKNLFSKLISLLPNQNAQVEGAPLPDQIDEAVEYIKSMKTKLDELKQKKEFLLQRTKSNSSYITNDQNQAKNSASPSPLIEVQDMGPNLDVVIANPLRSYSNFRDVIRLVHQHGVEIASANFTRDGISCVQALHDKIAQPKPGFDGATLSRKMKEVMNCGGGSSSGEVVESQLNLWDYEINSNFNWEFDIPEVLLPGLQEFMINMKEVIS